MPGTPAGRVTASDQRERLLSDLQACFEGSVPIRHAALIGIPESLRALITLLVGLIHEGATEAGARKLTPAESLKAVALDLRATVEALAEVEDMPRVTSQMVTRARESRRLIEAAIRKLAPANRRTS